MSEELILKLPEPEIPENWDYEESVITVNGFKYKWKDLTLEFASELRIAQVKLVPSGKFYGNQWSGTKVPDQTWDGYCKDIGSSRRVVNRWLARWYGKLKKEIITPEIKELNEYNITDINPGWHKIGNQFLYFGSNLDKEFIEFLPYCKFGFADPPYNAGVANWDFNFDWQQDLFIDKCEVMAVTPGGWGTFDFYKKTNMPYVWEIICWIKNGMTHGKCGFANYIKASIFSNLDKVSIPQDLFTITIKTGETSDTQHKGRKPYEFMTQLIELFSNEGDFIFDIFAGSGTTLLLSEKLNRISYNAEIDKQYCIDIINRAIENKMTYNSG